jgi:hypothetical protein
VDESDPEDANMIRIFVLFGLVVIIFYCATQGTRADAPATAAARPLVRVHRQFIPGALAALHASSHNLVASTRALQVTPGA